MKYALSFILLHSRGSLFVTHVSYSYKRLMIGEAGWRVYGNSTVFKIGLSAYDYSCQWGQGGIAEYHLCFSSDCSSWWKALSDFGWSFIQVFSSSVETLILILIHKWYWLSISKISKLEQYTKCQCFSNCQNPRASYCNHYLDLISPGKRVKKGRGHFLQLIWEVRGSNSLDLGLVGAPFGFTETCSH